MKSLNVLLASSGPFGNIIKIRPPQCLDIHEANACLAALEQSPAEVRSVHTMGRLINRASGRF